MTIDLQQIAEGTIEIRNKSSRVASLIAAMDTLISEARVESGVAASLHGQLNFAQGQYLGAPMKPAMQFFSRVASQGWDEQLRPELAVACLYAKSVFEQERARMVVGSLLQNSQPELGL